MKNETDRFIKLRNDVVWNSNGEKSLLLNTNAYAILTMAYVEANYNNIFDRCTFSITSIIESLGETVNAKRNVKDVRAVLSYLADIEYITDLTIQVDKIKINDYVQCKLNKTFKDTDGKDIGWFAFNYKDYIKILKCKSKTPKKHLINILCYITSRTRKARYDTALVGGKARVFWDTESKISTDLGLSNKTFEKYRNELAELGLITFANIGLIKKGKEVKTASNIYTVYADENEIKEGLKQSRLYYEQQGYIVTGNKKPKDTIEEINTIDGINSTEIDDILVDEQLGSMMLSDDEILHEREMYELFDVNSTRYTKEEKEDIFETLINGLDDNKQDKKIEKAKEFYNKIEVKYKGIDNIELHKIIKKQEKNKHMHDAKWELRRRNKIMENIGIKMFG